MIINLILKIKRILILTLSFLITNMAFAADCPEIALDVSGGWSDGGYSYSVPVRSGIPADNKNSPRQSSLRLFEDGLEMGPAHSRWEDIRNVGQGKFSHWSLPDGTVERLRFSSSDDAYPGTNGKSYSYCLTPANNSTAAALTTKSSFHAPAPTSPLVVNVRNTGATGNGSTNDTAAIQAAVNQVGGTGGTVFVPAGTYMIDAEISVKLKSDMTFKLDSAAVLKAIPNSVGSYRIIQIFNLTNVNVIGGTIKGERNEHLLPGNMTMDGLNGQSGHGIRIWEGSNIFIENVLARDCWGDGFYVGKASNNINFYSVVADANRRQGMSIVGADGVVVRDSIFKNTIGTPPQSGIDIEPNTGEAVNNVQLLNSQFIDNHGNGIQLWGGFGPISNVNIDKNTIINNDRGIKIAYTTGNIITNNTITDRYCIELKPGSSAGNTISGNTCNSQ